MEERRPAWALEDRSKALEREAAGVQRIERGGVSALALLPDHAEARRLKAEIFWEKYLEVEAKSGGAMALHYRHSAEACNDGSLDARIRGDGTLSVRAVAYTCACLGEGRPVERDGLWTMEYHAWSGRRRDGAEVDDARELEEGAPWRLRVHGAECRAAELPGAEAWAYRYEEEDRRLVPVTPAGAGGSACPAAVLDELWGSSPYRPRGPGIAVGRTPAARRPWPHGSWVLVVARQAGARRVPFVVPRGRGRPQSRSSAGETPLGYLPVSGGTFEASPTAAIPARSATRTATPDLEDFLLARHPSPAANTSVPERPRARPGQAPRAPGHGFRGAVLAPRRRTLVLPTTRTWRARAKIRRTARLSNVGDWEPDWPVVDVCGSTRRPTRNGCPPDRVPLHTTPHVPVGTRRTRCGHPGLPWGNGPTPRYAT